MYIQPNSDLIIMHGIPLDNTYTDTVAFASLEEQYTWFNGYYNRIQFSNLSYQRVNKNSVRVEILADDIAGYNYMMFRNTSYGNKWFYAFITQVNYINDNCTEIEYEIDVMQTWYFDVTLDPCYVEREHSATDVAGEYIAPEPIDPGTIICQATEETDYFDSYVAVIAIAETESVSASGLLTVGEDEGGES